MSRVLWAAIATLLCALAVPALASAKTVVSLEFDDGLAQQYQALSLMSSHGMHGTFYVNSGVIGVNSANMTWSQLHDIANAGDEVAGHTVSHTDLPTVSTDEAKRQICDDRNNLLAQGFSPTDFAYPYGAYNSTVEQIVQQCGYNSGREVGGLSGSSDGCTQNCVWAESLSPPDLYATREHESVIYNTSLSTIESWVTDAEQHGGGWVQIIFHHLCTTTCDSVTDLYGITVSNFTALLDWLQARSANGTVEQTVNQVIGGPVNPPVQSPPAPAASGSNYVVNPSFETRNPATGNPYCYQFGQFGSNTATWGQVPTAHTGSYGTQLQVTNFSSGDAKIITQQDLGECSPTVTPGARYQVSAWYQSTAPTVFELYTRNALGGWSYWTQSQTLPASSSWSQASFTAPALPAGATGLSFGLALLSNGTLTVDDYAEAPAPTVGPGGNMLQNPSLESVTASGTPTCFTTGKGGGTNTTTWSHVTTANTGSYAEQAQVTAYTSGGAVLVSSQDSGSCAPSATPGHSYAASVFYQSDHPVYLETYYHDAAGWHFWKQSPQFAATSTWTRATFTTPALPSGADLISVGLEMTSVGTMTMDDFSLSDAAVTAPTASLTAPAGGSTVSGSAVTLTASATAGPFAQIDHVNFLVDGQIVATSTTAPYSATWDSTGILDGTHTFAVQAVDWAGNATTSAPVTATVKNNTTPPTVSLTSPGDGANVSGSVSVSADASASGTAGIDHVDFLVDGNVVASSSTSPYKATWDSTSVADGPHTVTVRAYDTSGNSNESSPASITVDNTAPSSAATAPGTVTNATFTVGYTASDATSGIAVVDLYAKGPDDSGYTLAASNRTGANSSNFSYTASEGDGTYSFYTRATDAAGNVESPHPSADATTIVEATPPSSSASAPAYATSTSWKVGYTAAASPAARVAEVDLYAKAPGDARYTMVASDTSGNGSGQFSYTASAGDGGYSFYTVAVDNAGNVEAAPANADATTTLDTVAPSSSASAPASAYSAPVNVSYTASDNQGGSGLAEVDLYAKGPVDSGYRKVAGDTTPSASGAFSYVPAEGNGTYAFYTIAVDKAGNTESAPGSAEASTTYLADTSAPTSHASSPATVNSATWTISYAATDNQGGSGLASVELWVKSPNAIGYSKVAASAGSSPSGTFSYTATAGDGSYAIYTIAVDQAGNRETAPSSPEATTVLDTTPPTAKSLSTTNVSGGTKGKAEKGDSVTFTYSETIKPSSILAGWTGASTPVQVDLSAPKNAKSVLTVWNSAGTVQLPLANPLGLGGAYNGSALVVFNATMVQNGSAITITLGNIASGTVAGSAVKGGTLTWTPSAGATDLAGNAASTASVSAAGPAF